jgi:hypothetical protein
LSSSSYLRQSQNRPKRESRRNSLVRRVQRVYIRKPKHCTPVPALIIEAFSIRQRPIIITSNKTLLAWRDCLCLMFGGYHPYSSPPLPLRNTIKYYSRQDYVLTPYLQFIMPTEPVTTLKVLVLAKLHPAFHTTYWRPVHPNRKFSQLPPTDRPCINKSMPFMMVQSRRSLVKPRISHRLVLTHFVNWLITRAHSSSTNYKYPTAIPL